MNILYFLFFNVVYGSMLQKSLHISQATYCNNSIDWSCKTCDDDAYLLDDIENHGVSIQETSFFLSHFVVLQISKTGLIIYNFQKHAMKMVYV